MRMNDVKNNIIFSEETNKIKRNSARTILATRDLLLQGTKQNTRNLRGNRKRKKGYCGANIGDGHCQDSLGSCYLKYDFLSP